MTSSTNRKIPLNRPLLLVNISQLLTLRSSSRDSGPRRGADLQELGLIKDGAVLCIAGRIVFACSTKDALSDPWVSKNRKKIVEIDCSGQVVVPGFVDSHTHPAFVYPRLLDFEKRITGATYEQIAEAGGGIRSSLEGVRKAGRKQLADHVLNALQEMAEQGTTTVEAKSGYGLTVEAEIKSLEAIQKAARKWPGTVVPTLLGAHVVPKNFGQGAGVCEACLRRHDPDRGEAKTGKVCRCVYRPRRIHGGRNRENFSCATDSWTGVRAHVCQLTETALQPLLHFNVASFDHLDHVSDADIRRLALSRYRRHPGSRSKLFSRSG